MPQQPMTFEERHAQVDGDPLVELKRRLELWAAAPDSRGQPLMACVVPLSTVRQAVAELASLREDVRILRMANADLAK